MKLRAVTAYDQRFARLTFEHEIETDGQAVQAVRIPNLLGKLYGDRVAVSAPEDSDCLIVETSVQKESVSLTSWLESGSARVRELYEETQKLLKARAKQEQLIKHLNSRDQIMMNLVTNLFDPKTLASKGPEILGSEPRQLIANAGSIIEDMRSFEANTVDEKIAAGQELLRIKEKLQAAEVNLFKEIALESPSSRDGDDAFARLFELMRQPRTAEIHSLMITVKSDRVQRIPLSIEYLVTGVGWRPYYEFRLSGDRLQHCHVNYFTRIWQNSGIDWQGAAIRLATGDPEAALAPPPPKKSFVDILTIIPPTAPDAPIIRPMALRARCLGAAAPEEFAAVEVREAFANQRIDLPGGTELASRAAEYKIPIAAFDLSGELFHHIEASQQATVAYKTLLIKNSSEWTLFDSNKIDLFVNNSYVGNTRLARTVQPGTSFVLYAGADERVEVSDLGDKEFKSKTSNLLTKNTHKEETGTQLEVRNCHPAESAVTLLVSFALPESRNEQVTVELGKEQPKARALAAVHDVLAHVEAAPADDCINTTTGNYVHCVRLRGGERVRTSFSYTVGYPVSEKIKTWTE